MRPSWLAIGLICLIAVAGCGSGGDESRWSPAPGADWQWQLQGELATKQPVAVWDIDMDAKPRRIAELASRGARLVCHFSAGTVESWRSDAEDFPSEVVGLTWGEWPDERFIDYRRLDLVGPVIEARLDRCAAAGFDAVEPDVIDSFTEATGFELVEADARRYLEWLIEQAHARELSIALKNTPELVDLPVDFAIVEDCFVDEWCDQLEPVAARGGAILAAEYTDRVDSITPFCARARAAGISLILKDRDLALARRATCVSPRQ